MGDFVDHLGVTRELEERALSAVVVAALINLDLGFLAHLERRLGGEIRGETSLATPFRNSYYVILRAPGLAHGGCKYQVFAARVLRQNGECHPNVVAHGFATQAESSAYLAGARRPWPPQLHP